ncbi:hypothetical protein [Brevundimonas sp.]|uniref:hypothetical protein n=1 Tax=Brevundimonas sp. TaxID=1871086 RepID=UPI001A2FA3D1|nr:hypothetical protein [Brevundimonas sp.]MBJ7484635.1 hypothetical protein [Brevundimonas sp.]
MTDRTIRSLANLRGSASTARVLNLSRVHREHGDTDAWRDQPMFRNPMLNRSMIVKHRLRRDEIDRFRFRRYVATKIILPIDAGDLRAGGRYLFVGEAGFETTMTQAFGLQPDHPDIQTLRIMDGLPGLDPFLLREQLRRNGVTPAPCYFNLSEADLGAMIAFVAEEISPLVDLSLGPDWDLTADNPVARLTDKILSSSAGEDLSALGLTLRLAPEEYEEGVFCWKGFLYYKWVLRGAVGEIGDVMEAVRVTKPRGRPTNQQYVTLARSRETIRRRIIDTCDTTANMLRVYDDAFRGLTQEGRPTAFRDFLRDAPHLFAKLGERLGAIQHIVSFWKYRTAPGKPVPTPDELLDMLADFEVSLTGRDDAPTGSFSLAA